MTALEDGDPAEGVKVMQGPTPDIPPRASWTNWVNSPSTGGVSGRPFVSMARYNPAALILEVVFENSGRRWQYDGVDEEAWREYRSGMRSWPMLFQQRRFGPGQASRPFEKI